MHRDIIVIGASAGGVEALCSIVSGFPADLAASVFIVLHLAPTSTSALPAVLQRSTSLAVSAAVDGEAIERGRIYVAQPDHHLLLQHDAIHLSRGPRENGQRPAVDFLFRSAAHVYGARVIGVVLSGALDDGAVGLHEIKSSGGMSAVQDPDDAAFPSMPRSALEATSIDIVAKAEDLGQILGEMSGTPIGEQETKPVTDDASSHDEGEELKAWESEARSYPPSVFTCPECHGTLFEVTGGMVGQYRCRVGHGFSSDSLLAGQSETLEAALWTALRVLDERNDLLVRLAARAQRGGQGAAAARFEERVRDGRANADVLRRVLLGREITGTGTG